MTNKRAGGSGTALYGNRMQIYEREKKKKGRRIKPTRIHKIGHFSAYTRAYLHLVRLDLFPWRIFYNRKEYTYKKRH